MTIKNIHIRYEDRITNPSAPFSLGITLSNLTMESTDENWKKAIVTDISKIYKVSLFRVMFELILIFYILLDCSVGGIIPLLELSK